MISVILDTHAALSRMIGRWADSIPPEVRAELHRVDLPLLEMLERVEPPAD